MGSDWAQAMAFLVMAYRDSSGQTKENQLRLIGPGDSIR